MAVNPNEYHMVVKERAKDAIRDAENWRQRQAIRRLSQSRPEASAVVYGLKRFVKHLTPVQTGETACQPDSTVSSPAG
jgi:sirohydrochlorin ferrochelatase